MNVPPKQDSATPWLKRDRAAAWLRRNDPDHKKNEQRARRNRERAAAQAANNPALVAKYRHLMLKT